MPNVLIFGGNGKVARHLTQTLTKQLQSPYVVYSIIRNAEQTSELEELGAKAIVQSIEPSSAADLAATLQSTKTDVVIWSAGAGSGDDATDERIAAVDRDGAIKAMDACAAAGVKRFITVSAMDVRDHSKPEPDWYDNETKTRAAKVFSTIQPFMDAKFEADKELVTGNKSRQLSYTIIRPAGLGAQPGTGKIFAGKVQLCKVIKREDLALVIAACIEDDGTIGLSFDVSAGDIPVSDAVSRVVRDRLDVFSGMY